MLKVGDEVRILSGVRKGQTLTIAEVFSGSGMYPGYAVSVPERPFTIAYGVEEVEPVVRVVDVEEYKGYSISLEVETGHFIAKNPEGDVIATEDNLTKTRLAVDDYKALPKVGDSVTVLMDGLAGLSAIVSEVYSNGDIDVNIPVGLTREDWK